MKADEAPKKIQIHLIKNDYDDWSVRGYSFLEDKQMGMVEYTRTDAFMKKASEWLCDNYDKYIRVIGSSIYPAYSDLCRDFQNAMKGENE